MKRVKKTLKTQMTSHCKTLKKLFKETMPALSKMLHYTLIISLKIKRKKALKKLRMIITLNKMNNYKIRKD